MLKLNYSSVIYPFKKGHKDISILLKVKLNGMTSNLDRLIIEKFKCLILTKQSITLIFILGEGDNKS